MKISKTFLSAKKLKEDRQRDDAGPLFVVPEEIFDRAEKELRGIESECAMRVSAGIGEDTGIAQDTGIVPVAGVGALVGLDDDPDVGDDFFEGSALGREYYPTMRCDSCTYAGTCALFKAGYECGYSHVLDHIPIDTVEGRRRIRQDLVRAELERVTLAIIQERSAGIEDENLDNRLMRALDMVDSLDSGERQNNSGTGGVNILQQIFSNQSGPVGPPQIAIQVEPEAAFVSVSDVE